MATNNGPFHYVKELGASRPNQVSGAEIPVAVQRGINGCADLIGIQTVKRTRLGRRRRTLRVLACRPKQALGSPGDGDSNVSGSGRESPA